jgi:hypothetical protein
MRGVRAGAGPGRRHDAAPLPDLPEAFAPEWLSDTVTRPHANVATSATRPQFEILPIDAVELDAVGLLPRSITGLPPNLWGASETGGTGAPVPRAARQRPARRTVADRDAGAGGTCAARGRQSSEGELFLARLDMLLARGALDPALALMERAGPTDPQVFRRFFDVSLSDRPWRPRLPRDGRQPRHRTHLSRRASSASRAAATGPRRRCPSARARRWGGSSRGRPT